MTDRHLPDPLAGPGERSNGHRTGSSPGRSAPLPQPAADRTQAATAPTAVAARVSTLDRLTLQLGVVVAVVIATCSYAVSATSLYALGVQAGYSWWQAAAVPVVADGPAIYGMFRIVSRSRRGANGAGYGWLLVICGTAASIGGNVAHAQPDLVAQAIAAAIPLAVLAMLEGLKGDAGEVTRLAAQAADPDHATAPRRGPASFRRAPPSDAPTPRPSWTALAAAGGSQRPALPAGARPADGTSGPGAAAGRLCPAAGRTASPGRPAPWPRRPAAAAAAPPASCNASAQRSGSGPGEPAELAAARRRPRLCLPGHPGAAPALPPPPPRATSSPSPATNRCRARRWGRAARVGIRAAARSPSTPSARLVPHGVKDATVNRARVLAWWTRHPQANIGLATGHPSTSWTSTAPPARQAIRDLAADAWPAELGAAGPDRRGRLALLPGPHRPRQRPPGRPGACGLAGPGRLCGRPTQPPRLRPPLPVGRRPRPRHPTRPGPRGAAGAAGAADRPSGQPARSSSRPPATARVTAMRGRPWPRSWPGSPPPRSATATASCGSRPATSTTWSPPAPSTTARSTRGSSRPPNAAGCWPRSRARPAAPWPRAARSAWPIPAAPPSPPAPNAPSASPTPPLRAAGERPRRGGERHGRRRPAGRLTLFAGWARAAAKQSPRPPQPPAGRSLHGQPPNPRPHPTSWPPTPLQRGAAGHLQTPAPGGHEFGDWPLDQIASGFGGDLDARHRHDHTRLATEFTHTHPELSDPSARASRPSTGSTPTSASPPTSTAPTAASRPDREPPSPSGCGWPSTTAARTTATRSSGSPARTTAWPTPSSAARPQPTRTRSGPERLGPER